MAFGLRDLAQVYISAEDKTKPAFDAFKRNVEDGGAVVDKFKGILAGLGVSLSTGAFAVMVQQQIDYIAALDDMRKATGASVESLSVFREVAKLSSTETGAIENALQRLARNMLTNEAAFQRLGLSVRGANGELKNNGEFLFEVAAKLDGLKSPTERVAMAQELLSKSGAKVLPFLHDLVEEGGNVVRITAAQAELADSYGDTLAKLGWGHDRLKREIALGLLPVMNDLAVALLGSRKEGEGLLGWVARLRREGTIDEWAQNAAIGVGYFIDVLKNAARFMVDAFPKAVGLVGKSFETLGRLGHAANPMRGGFLLNLGEARSALSEFSAFRNEIGADFEAGLGQYGFGTVESIRAAFANRKPGSGGGGRSGGGTTGADPDAVKATADAYEQLLAQLRKKLVLDKESSEVERLLIDLQEKRYARFTTAERAELLALAARIDARNDERVAIKAASDAIDEQIKREAERAKQVAEFNRVHSESLQQIEFEASLYGMTEVQRETAIALRKLEQDYIKASIGLIGEEAATLKTLYEAQRAALTGAIASRDARRASEERRKEEVDAWRRVYDDIGKSLTDALFRGFEDGKGFLRNFRDTLVNTFKSTVLRVPIQAILTGVAGGVGGALGLPGLANAAGGGGLGNLLSFGNTASNFFGGSQFIADIGNFFGSIGSITETGATFGLFDAIGGFASAHPLGLALGALGLLAGGGLFGGSKTPAVLTGLDLQGMASYGGFSGVVSGNDANQGYRWALPHNWYGEAPGLNNVVTGAYAEFEKLARIMGLDPSGLKTVTAPISIGGIQGESADAVIGALGANIGQLTDQLATKLIPNLKDFAQANETLTQTFMRLSQERVKANVDEIFGRMSAAVQLRDASSDLWTDGRLSPLTNRQRFMRTRRTYEETLAAAQAGDVEAIAELGGASRAYLEESRNMFASSAQYRSIFGRVQRDVGGLVDETLTEESIRFAEMGLTLKDINVNIKDLPQAIAQQLKAAIDAWQAADLAAQKAAADQVAGAVSNAAATAALVTAGAGAAGFIDDDSRRNNGSDD